MKISKEDTRIRTYRKCIITISNRAKWRKTLIIAYLILGLRKKRDFTRILKHKLCLHTSERVVTRTLTNIITLYYIKPK